jgi:hypothetical protein
MELFCELIISDSSTACIILGCAIMVIAAAIQTGATGLAMFEGARFFMGKTALRRILFQPAQVTD